MTENQNRSALVPPAVYAPCSVQSSRKLGRARNMTLQAQFSRFDLFQI